MEIKKCIKKSFCVIGKEGSTNDGNGFIQKLWEDANSHYSEVSYLTKKDKKGNPVGYWGAMSDFSRTFKPWDNFSNGLYLAGVEVEDNAEPPTNWTKWKIPAYEYIYVKAESSDTFSLVQQHMEENNLHLIGAVHDFICPEENGQQYMFFPIRRVYEGEIE